MIRYTIRLVPNAHLLHVSIDIDPLTAPRLVLRLPTWIAGSYKIRDFARHIRLVMLETASEVFPLAKDDTSTWSIDLPDSLRGKPLRISYDLWAYDESVRESYLDSSRCFINPAASLLYPEMTAAAPIRIDIASEDAATRSWSAATALESADDALPLGSFVAPNYDTLVDSPILLGDLTCLSFTAGNTPHCIAINALLPNFDAKRLTKDLQSICETIIGFFDPTEKRCPMQRYVFLLNTAGNTFGGLEHCASTALASELHTLPCTLDEKRNADYLELLRLCAHEYFHAWWVKRVSPAAFIGCEHRSEVRSDLLWFFEGVTSYYENRMLLYASILDEAAYLETVGKQLHAVLSSHAPQVQTLAEAGLDAWIKFYQPNANGINAYVNYYRQGALAAWMLDLALRKEGAALDDVLRFFWNDFVQNASNYRGITIEDIRAILSRLGGTGMTSLLQRLVFTPEAFPYEHEIEPVGLRLEAFENPAERQRLGIDGTFTESGLRVRHVLEDGTGMQAGLSPDDTIVAIDGFRARQATFGKFLNRHRTGDAVALDVFHGEALRHIQVPLGDSEERSKLVIQERTPVLNAWLKTR